MGQIESVRSDQAVLLSRAVEVATKQKQDEVEEKAEEKGTNQLVGNFEHQVKVNFIPQPKEIYAEKQSNEISLKTNDSKNADQ